jgi:hypothetical protein
LTHEQKLKALEKAWGYLDIRQVTLVASGWTLWIVKNYSGSPADVKKGDPLPGNPKAKKRLEYTGITLRNAVHNAYRTNILRK